MDRPTETISDRWRLYRRAREAGTPEVEAYDRYLHPRTRISEDAIAEELGVGAEHELSRGASR